MEQAILTVKELVEIFIPLDNNYTINLSLNSSKNKRFLHADVEIQIKSIEYRIID